MNDSGNELIVVLRRKARRRYRAEALALALRLTGLVALLAALAAVSVIMGVVSESSFWLRAALVILILLLPTLTLARAFRRVNTPAEAKQLDDAFGLKDRLTSALSFIALPERSNFQQVAVTDAGTHLPRIAARRETGVPFGRPTLTLLVGACVAAALLAIAWKLSADVSPDKELATIPGEERRTPGADKHGEGPTPASSDEPESSDEGLEPVDETKLTEQKIESVYSDAELTEFAAMSATETSEADRLLAQAAYLDETDLSDSGLEKGGASDDDRAMMKEPDMDMIRAMVKEAQKRKKEGRDQDGGGEDIKLEILVKTHARGAGKRPRKRPGGRRRSGGASGPSQDTRIKPRRVPVKEKVEFKIVSVRSLTLTADTAAKRVVLSEAIMRTSGSPEKLVVKSRNLAASRNEERSAPVWAQDVPPELRAVVSKYFEGLRSPAKSP